MYRYLHLDVFTSRPLEGNQLAVFPEPRDLTTDQMQRLAKEMNFSESTFILPAERGGDVRMRIFTPGEELPMAGHPTVGSTFALAGEGTIPRGRRDFVFELGIGPTPVSLEWEGDRLSFVWMTQPLPAFGPVLDDRAAVAAALGLEPAALTPDLPVERVSCGVAFLLVPLRTRAHVDRVGLDRRAFARLLETAGCPELPLYAFALDTEGGASSPPVVYSRMLAPGFGIAEDPATGSACGPLGSYLLQHRAVSAGQAQRIVNHQGVAMGRPSVIHISIAGGPERITGVRVGGEAVLVGRGEITSI